ncbi:MAG: SDR family oxidoreductase [Rhodobacteraceae bacterium]|nr:SDR family oxidoreductase [Paracoccaceae bacterium]
MGKLRKNVVVVAGSENIVGRAVVRGCADEGAKVVGLERRFEGFARHDPNAWERGFSEVESEFGSVSVFINAHQILKCKSIAALTPQEFQSDFDDLARASWLAQRAAIMALRRNGGGVIVNITSVLARIAAVDCASLCAAARGILMSTKSAALECARAKDNIVASAVLAGRIEGDPDHWPDGRILSSAPIVSPEDVAAGALFLATDGAAYMTGVEFPVDGGFIAS